MKAFSVIKNKNILVTIVSAVIAIAVATAVLVCLLSDKNPDDYATVLTVAGEDVAYGEFVIALDAEKADVAAYFYETYHLESGTYLWDRDTVYGEENPLEVLKEAATENIKLIKYQQHLMKKYGVAEDITYKKFIELWKADCEERAQKLKDDIPVYGPTEYSKSDYYNYLHSLRIDDLRKALYEESGLDEIEYRFTDELLEQKTEEEFSDIKVEINREIYDNITY